MGTHQLMQQNCWRWTHNPVKLLTLELNDGHPCNYNQSRATAPLCHTLSFQPTEDKLDQIGGFYCSSSGLPYAFPAHTDSEALLHGEAQQSSAKYHTNG